MTATEPARAARPIAPGIRAAPDEVAAFLFHEVRLLDERRYEEWVDLFADDGRYWVPCNEPGADPSRHVQIVYDDVASLRLRVRRLLTGKQYAQDPPSRTCHAVSNVYVPLDADADGDRAEAGGGEDEVVVHSVNTVVEARRHHRKNVFAALCAHRLRPDGEGFRIVEKRVDLVDNDQFYDDLTFLV